MRRLGVLALAAVSLALGAGAAAALGDLGVNAGSSWDCPESHPVKGNFTDSSGEPCVYYTPGGYHYARTKPERCYESEGQARADGCKKSGW